METQISFVYVRFFCGFSGFEEKKKQTHQTWKENDLPNTVHHARLIIQKDTAEATVDWELYQQEKRRR